MRAKRLVLIAVLLAFARVGPILAAEPVDYTRDVKPILKARCTSCHGAIRQKAGLRLDAASLIHKGGAAGPAVEPGKAAESLLIERITGADGAERMPPESEGVPLKDDEVAILRAWIEQGAKTPEESIPPDPRTHWAYQVPKRPNVPASSWGRNPIDSFLAAGHTAKGLTPNPPEGRDLWLRRVSLDLNGLPPTRAEIQAYRDDKTPDADHRVIDRLLASPRYGERWGRHWMDVWRYSDWYGLGAEIRFSHPHIWRWRDWIVESLNADKGYDRMIVEMLAGDEIAPEDPNTLRATGYLVRNWEIFNRNVWLANTVEHSARAFLGMTIQCARCHDHKFDPLSQVEYTRFRAFFEPIHVRIDRVPGEPDRDKGGLPRAFDDFMDTPTYRFLRGDEARPDKDHPLTPATPAVVGGSPLKIEPVWLPLTASVPDKRDFIVREARQDARQAVTKAKAAAEAARATVARTAAELASATEANTQAEAKGQADVAAAKLVETLAKASRAARDADDDRSIADSALALAEARSAALDAVLAVEKIEDEGGKVPASDAWVKAARDASSAQKKLAPIEAMHERLTAKIALARAQRAVDGLTESSDDPNAKTAHAARTKAATDLVAARARLAASEPRLAKALADANIAPTVAYTPRPLVFHRAKTTYRDTPPDTPYARQSTGRRLALANWITDRTNPLAARVAVNHIWARHFGEPLVASMFDFGLRTERPVQLDLLDWLAVELMDSGWSMKHLHRLILASEAYRMKSSDARGDSANAKIDPDNRYLWRMNVRRMEGEVVRDTLLSLAGTLDPTMGGPDLPTASAEAGNRRTLYYHYSNMDHIPFLTMFDAPSVDECYRRAETIVPQQALALSNSGLSLARATEVSTVIGKEVGESDTLPIREAFVVSVFERLLGRLPTPAERAECEIALNQLRQAAEAGKDPAPHKRARADLVHILFNHNDFVSIR